MKSGCRPRLDWEGRGRRGLLRNSAGHGAPAVPSCPGGLTGKFPLNSPVITQCWGEGVTKALDFGESGKASSRTHLANKNQKSTFQFLYEDAPSPESTKSPGLSELASQPVSRAHSGTSYKSQSSPVEQIIQKENL